MALEAQIVGQMGRLEGDPQLRGHYGRIPFSLLVSAGKAVLFEDGATAELIEGGATATLTEDEC